ncbi:hypothetical protein AQ490_02510 [Wenjunlia vitaminophila]|uniref:Secreted protein n=1 Tax=Wenjunlia vitaminophila TaxID=76728 RepID=A0A0T6LYK9_WENVI|nr:hypothetical protein [Wenjunlia vitaminophila]KRV51093.1 hypothetical protein AQ490_02510 [Wenjunlia vitaminophila]
MWDRRRIVSLVVAVVAAGTLAGCSGDGDVERSTDPPARSGEPARTATPGPGSEPSRSAGSRDDLRTFLLPLPEGAQPYGDVAGDTATLAEAAIGFGDGAEESLREHGFQQAALRAYRTGDGHQEVNVKLLRFGSPAGARGFADAVDFSGPAVPLPGHPEARATRLDSAAAESTDAMVAVATEGDVQFTITITGTAQPRAEDMAALVERQQQRLRAGR